MYQFLGVRKVHSRGDNGLWFVIAGGKVPDAQLWFQTLGNGLMYVTVVALVFETHSYLSWLSPLVRPVGRLLSCFTKAAMNSSGLDSVGLKQGNTLTRVQNHTLSQKELRTEFDG